MRARIGLGITTLFGAAFTLTTPSFAGPARDGIRLDTLQPASEGSEFFRAEGPRDPVLPEQVGFAVGLGLEYAKAPLRVIAFDSTGTERALTSLVDHAVFARIGASIAPASWLSFEMSLPFAVLESGDGAGAYYGGEQVLPASSGVGDFLVGLQIQPVNTGPFDFMIGGRFWAPIGSAEAYLSDHRFRAEASLSFAGEIGPALYGCTFSASPGFFLKRDGDRVGAACGAHFKVNPVFAVGVEPSFAMISDSLQTPDPKLRYVVEPLASIKLSPGSLRVGLGAGPSFGAAPGAAALRVLLNVAYAGSGAPAHETVVIVDRDLDGIRNDDDACPDTAGPRSDDKTRSGCPVEDRDADGIRDVDDYCPERAGIPYNDPKANGCPDSDNDDLPDPLDTCPTEPGGKPGGCPKYARLSGGTFKITPAIEFKEATLPPEGVAAIEEIASTMRANPKLEQVSISLGTRGVRTALSDQRAQEIILILRNANLDSSRYEVVFRDELKAGTVQARLVR